MQVSFNQVKAITDTLPIGLYVSRRIDTELKEKEQSSYYDPETDKIVISYSQLTEGFANLKPTDKVETIVRSMYYHEVSHAFLTPLKLYNNDPINIFEDERIETILKKYYYGVDFEQCKRAVCGYDPNHIPTDSLEAFFYLVRFRQCSQTVFLDRVKRIIERYSTMHRGSDQWEANCYYSDVMNLYQDFCKDCQKRGIPQVLGMGQGQGQGQNQSMPNSQGQQDPNGQGQQCFNGQDPNAQGKGIKQKTQASPLSAEQIQKLLSESLNLEFNENFHSALSVLFENFRKKNSKGSCLQGYSGVLNPRLADRMDYRFFERSTSARGNNQFGTFHLNLFVDTSGSFRDNEQAVNQIIKSLCLLEKKNPNFSFDIITTDTETKVLPKGKRFIQCCGGTYLGTIIEEIYRKQQKPQTYNYNIILFDGDAYCSYPNGRENKAYNTRGQGFATFANNNCTIISDYDNKVYIDKFAPNTRTIYTNRYVEELFDNILKVMQRALS